MTSALSIPYNPETLVFMFKSVTVEEILQVSAGLKNKNSSGIDGITTSVLKKCVAQFVQPLTYIVNNSLK